MKHKIKIFAFVLFCFLVNANILKVDASPNINEKYIFILPAHYTWSANSGKTWDKGNLGSIQTQSYNIDLQRRLNIEPEKIESVKVEPYNKNNPNWQNWDNETFFYSHTEKMGDNAKQGFDDEYMPELVSSRNEISNVSWNPQTGFLQFKQTYSLNSHESNEGLNLHNPLQRYGELGLQEVFRWIGTTQPPEIMDKLYEAIGNTNSQLRGYTYFQPFVITIKLKVPENDIGFIEPVELYNSVGEKVNFVYPNEAHKVKFNIKHFLGETAIGLDPINNPKTTIDVEIRDGNNAIVRKSTLRSDEILNPNSQITMDVNNIATPTTILKACATINPIHKEKGLNSNPQNDTICKVFAQAKNYAIKDLKVSPHYINIPDGVNATTQTLNFRFVVAHEGQSGYGDNPIVVVRQGGRELVRASVSVSAGHEITEVWPIPVNLRFGENDFEVEVNPAPRTIEEFRSTGLNPYADNKKTDSVIVRRNPECIDCDAGVRTRNTWSEIFDMHEHLAHREYYTSCTTNKDGSVTCRKASRCVTDSDRYWTETKNFYEEYKIQHVYFRSKWSKDTRGGDGWVDLLTSEGKIKSGYGFELKIVTKYETNRGSIPPVPNTWRKDCSYLSRYPGIGYASNPNIVSLKMPYSDGFGNNVCYILNAENSKGSWTNNTKEYQLPYRDSFNLKTERKIYINQKARPGIQELQIVTDKFDGYDPDAPVNVSNKKTLQDCKTVKFEILANDDLKSHIVQ